MNRQLSPFRYPSTVHMRRHGPSGYKQYRHYRPWLEDEFTFRCVYCLKRQRWCPTDVWAVEHLISQHEAPELKCDYDNLILTCQWCNNKKLAYKLPDPMAVAYGDCLEVDEESALVKALTDDGEILLRVLKLNHQNHVAMRRGKLRDLKVLAECSPEDWKRLMGFPDMLPNLKRRFPRNNTRPIGKEESWYEQKKAGRLPEVYE